MVGTKGRGAIFRSGHNQHSAKDDCRDGGRKPRPPVVSVETESVVGLEEKDQVSEQKIDSENDSSKECSNDEQDRYTTSNEKTTSIGMVIGDMVLDAETTPIDMIIGDKADMEKSHSAKLFKLKAEIGEIIMLGGLNNCSMRSVAKCEKYLAKSNIFGDHFFIRLSANSNWKF